MYFITGVLIHSENDTNFIQLKSILNNYDISIESIIFNNPFDNITKKCMYTSINNL